MSTPDILDKEIALLVNRNVLSTITGNLQLIPDQANIKNLQILECTAQEQTKVYSWEYNEPYLNKFQWLKYSNYLKIS